MGSSTASLLVSTCGAFGEHAGTEVGTQGMQQARGPRAGVGAGKGGGHFPSALARRHGL